jgi:hypothetical protein
MTTNRGSFEVEDLMGMRVTTGPEDRWREDECFLFSDFSGLVLRLEQSWCLVVPHLGHGDAPMP